MPRRAPRATRLGLVLAALLLLSACGSEEPEALQPMEPEVPADLCALVPDATRTGLVTNSNSSEDGHPTAACSLRSPDASSAQVTAVVTWTQLDDEDTATTVLASQCRAMDPREYQERPGFRARGADESCAAVSRTGGDSATLAALADREVVTVRYTSSPPGRTPSLQTGQQMLEGVLASMAG